MSTLLLMTFSIRSGILDTRRMLDEGMKVGLGTGKSTCVVMEE